MKLPKPHSIAIIIFFLIIGFFALSFFRVIDVRSTFAWIAGSIVGWIAIVIIAIFGGVAIGMLYSYRILRVETFTPFEQSMFELKKEFEDYIKENEEKLEEVMNLLKKK